VPWTVWWIEEPLIPVTDISIPETLFAGGAYFDRPARYTRHREDVWLGRGRRRQCSCYHSTEVAAVDTHPVLEKGEVLHSVHAVVDLCVLVCSFGRRLSDKVTEPEGTVQVKGLLLKSL
jgi:hypothetical protein